MTDTNYKRARELKYLAENWLNQNFNFIQLEVYEKLDEYLFESILFDEDSELDTYICHLTNDEREEYQELADEKGEDLEELIRLTPEFQDYLEEQKSNNYPIWGTLFECRGSGYSELIEAAQKVGLVVIDKTEYFNVTLGSTSCGHSFYSSYWIPLYLELHPNKKEQFKDVDFSMV